MSTRSDAWEAKLPAETAKELYRLTKCPTEEEAKAGRPWLRDFDRDVLPYLSLHGIVAPSHATWFRFKHRMRMDEAAETVISVETSKRIAQGITAAKIDPQLAADMMTSLSVDEAAKPPEQRNEKVMQIFASAAAMFKASEQRDRELALKAAAQQTKDEQLKLAREKFEAAERRENAAKAALGDTKLTNEAKLAKMKEIFG
ncbi:MAG: hypothetical protein IJI73_09275 [Kiritimatiellae bacterium]|nr:hypothetical protein [Kiritimatiellia bacterium]